MANDSTQTDHSASGQDTTPVNDGYFTDMQGEDAFFGPEQLAQANTGGAPVVVPVPQDQNVIRVKVNPGEILELSSPFDSGAELLGREADGNLAIRIGDVTVILVGFVDANTAAPVVVETSDGKPIDVATLLASTDPTIDIQTAAGPGDAAQGGQGADNTGAILAQLASGNGLGGLNAVGALDATQLSYGLIDNSIRLDRADALLGTLGTGFKGLAEPLLRDPFNSTTFNDFTTFITNYKTDVNGNPGDAWADFRGTAANGADFDSYLEQTSFTNLVTHTSTNTEPLYIDTTALALQLAGMTSNQHDLYIDLTTVDTDGHATTVFVRREGDDALILVIHAHEAGHDLQDDTTYSSGDYQIDTYLINRLDHPDQGQDILDLDIPYAIRDLSVEEQLPTFTNGTVEVQILDDIPITGETDYYSFLHATSCKDALDCFSAFLGGKITDYVVTNDAGHVDEDYIFHGNRDKDNAFGPDSDSDRGDDIGDKFVVGMLNINFGADGPSGEIPEGDKHSKTDPIFHDATPPALQIAGLQVGDAYPDATSHGHDLVVLKHEKLPFPFSTVEMVQVGYADETASRQSLTGEGGSDDVVVFTLLLQTGPNLPLFGGFVFEQCAPLDHAVGATLETNLPLNFQVIATDDDGDHPIDPVTIAIQVNDDAPTFSITYTNEDPKNCEGGEGGPEVESLAVSSYGGHVDHYTTKDFGHVDEDWLNGAVSNDGRVYASGPGNHDQDGVGHDNANLYGDDKGGLEVCGQIKVKYGADGPSDAPGNGDLALKTYDTSGAAPLFVNGDGSTLTSDGKPLVVLVSTEGHLVVGVDFQELPGEGEGGSTLFIPAQIVFDLTLNPSTGKFDFNLMGAIDHLPSTVAGEPESNLVLSFNVGSAEDFDGDKVLGAINIKVNDDKPEVGIVYYNELPGSSGDDGLAAKKDTDFGRIDEDWLQGPRDFIAAPNQGNEDRDAYNNSNANQFGDDYGSTHLEGRINMKYGADGPGSQTIGLATLAAATDVDGHPLTTAGGTIPLVVLSSEPGEIRIGYNDGESDHTVFLLTLETAGPNAGNFDFTQFEPIDHPVASPIEDNVYLTFNAGSITDGDGDTVNAVIKIQVNDDVPETQVTYYSGDSQAPETDFITYGAPVVHYGQIDEDFLPLSGNQDHDNNPAFNPSDPARGDEAGGLIVTGDLGGTNYGADGPAGTPGKTFALIELNEGDAFNDADGNQLKSHGNPLVVLSSDGQTLDVGYPGDSGDTVVFTLTMTGDTGFEFELKKPLDETPVEGGKLEDGLVLVFGADNGAPTDKDGDPAARIVIHVNDDAPMACEVSYTSYDNGSDDGRTTTSNVDGHGLYGQVDEDWLSPYPITNGSFEDPTVSGTFIPLPGGSADLNGWTVGGEGVDHIGNYWQASDGDQSLDMSNLDAGSISKELTGLTAGQAYTVYFDMAGNPDGGPNTVKLEVDAASDTESYTFDTTGHTKANMGWVTNSFTFVALGPTETLTFTSLTAGAFGPALDHVIIVADVGNHDLDNHTPGSPDDAARGDTIGSSISTGTVTINFGADGPADNAFALVTASKVGDTFVDEGGATFISHGNVLEVLEAAGDHISVGYGDKTVFEIHIDQNTGAFTFDLKAPLDHAKPDNFSLPEDSDLPVSFKVTATDFDGDSIDTTLNFHVNDDAPGKTTIAYSAAESLPNPDTEAHEYQTWGTVDEDWVAGGNQDVDGDASSTDGPGIASVTAQVIVPGFAPGFGGDGPADHPFSLFLYNEGDGFDNPLNGGSLFSQFDGTPLVVISSSESELVVGHKSGNEPVFSLTLDQDTGLATFTLLQGLQSFPDGDNLESGTKIGFTVKATDYDGDITYSTIRFRVNDDRPWAHDDDATVPAGALLIGNVLTGDPVTGDGKDTGSADGLRVASVNGFEMNQNHQVVINTVYGKLIVEQDGLYNFVANKSNGSDSLIYGFGYTVVDGDGDKSSAVLYVHIPAFEPAKGQVEYINGQSEQFPDPFNPDRDLTWGAVDEDYVKGGNQDNDGDASSTDGPGNESVTAKVTVSDFGVAGPATLPYSLFVETVGDKYQNALDGGGIRSQFDSSDMVIIKSTASELWVGHPGSGTDLSGAVFKLILDQSTGEATFTLLQGMQSFPFGGNTEGGNRLGFTVIATAADDQHSYTTIRFRINDDRPVAVKDVATVAVDNDNPGSQFRVPGNLLAKGNVLANDTGSGDGLRVTSVTGNVLVAVDVSGTTKVQAGFGNLYIDSEGQWTYVPDSVSSSNRTDIIHYTVIDGDGDTSESTLEISIPANVQGATHTAPATFDETIFVGGSFDATTSPEVHTPGHVVRIEGSDDGGTLTGDSAVFSLINGHGGDDTINGGAASDVLTGGDGNDTLNGKGGDDTLFGGNNDDDLYGGSGHDAMSGGAGNDTFHDVDADDLVGTNTLDGTHSIDGGDGIDTVQLGGLASFNSTQAGHMANVEILDFKANSAGDNVGTTVSLNYDAVYGVTQVGGLHELTIHGDGPGVGADHVTLENTAGHTWSAAVNDGTYNTYTSGAGAAQVTVHVDQDVAVV